MILDVDYIQDQVSKIRKSVDDKQLQLAWQTVQEVSWRRSTLKAKLEAASQDERLQKWREHFKNLFWKPTKIIDNLIVEIINGQLDIPTRTVSRRTWSSSGKKESRKAEGLKKISTEAWKTRKFDNILQLCNAPYKQNTIEKWMKGDFRIFKYYRDIPLTAYLGWNALPLSCIQTEDEKIL